MTAFIIGNGNSRLSFDLTELSKHGKMYGCNALYRDFEPQALGRMAAELVRRAFEQTQANDFRKNKWAEENNYQMIRVRYDESVTNRLANELL